MESLDLNINNYKLEDLLKLFNINLDFDDNDLRICKKKVLMMHPDKSNLSKEYFLFFCEAYKILYSIYNFKNKSKTNDNIKLVNNKLEYLVNDEEESNKEIINNLKKANKLDSKEFNNWFNKLFESINVSNDFNESGYGDWLKEDNDTIEKANNMENMNKLINLKKEKLRETKLANYYSIHEYNNNNFCDLTNAKPESYGSDMFSKLQYEDLRTAHEESVIPVTEKDFNIQYNSVEEIKLQRQNQNVEPLKEETSNEILNMRNSKDNEINSNRAFKLYKQQEDIENANKKWWGSLKQLK